MKTASEETSSRPGSHTGSGLNWDLIREKLAAEKNQDYWRSLDELAETPEFKRFAEREFPEQASEWTDAFSRRHFLQLMAASLALAGWSGCTQRQPNEKIVPYISQPEEMVLGKPLFYATAMTMGGFATGLLVKSREGRPVKVEGNPEHPFSLGATTVFQQASLLDLYDPVRSKAVLQAGEVSSWTAFVSALRSLLAQQERQAGAGLRLLTETLTSPALIGQIQTLLKKFPKAKWHAYEAVTREQVYEGARLAFGEPLETQYHIDKAKVIVSLDSDFLGAHPGSLRFARHFASGRRAHSSNAEINRLYVVETQPSVTGSMADHRLPLPPGEIPRLAFALSQAIANERPNGNEINHRWVRALAEDLKKNRGASLVIAGEQQPPQVHMLAHRINQALGNTGHTMTLTDRVPSGPWQQTQSLRELTDDIRNGRVQMLIVLGGNPAFTAPMDLKFSEALAGVNSVLRLGAQEDETSAFAHWHIPEAHYLESWGDARAYDGTVSIQQPLIDPFYGGKTALEVLEAMIAPESGRTGYEIVRDHWAAQKIWSDFESGWRKAVHDGVIAGSAYAAKNVRLSPAAESALPTSTSNRPSGPRTNPEMEIAFGPDPALWDGRYANNAWLQELPKPITKLSWDNAVQISPRMAEQFQLSNGDRVELRYRGRSLKAACWIVPGHADHAATFHFGHGRERGAGAGNNTGFNAFALRTSDAPWSGPGLEIRKISGRHKLASTQQHQSLEGRNIYRAGTFDEFRRKPAFAADLSEQPKATLYNLTSRSEADAAWGMAIDLNACIGCGACTMACYAENNIPVVGKDQVLRGREMQWIRIDTYFQGPLENPKMGNQPVPCMHCETAPCEVVCPVEATLHNQEGLNLQVYNRCIGTRYCSNNCPYKVRRFNFLQYSDRKTPSLKLMYNPDVTVRSRGVMEKCTYCVQRISVARVEADKENRGIRDGEVTTACAQACPTEAIVFGNLRDPNSRVNKLKSSPLNYAMLVELNTFPRTTYLAKLRNPNPALAEEPI